MNDPMPSSQLDDNVMTSIRISALDEQKLESCIGIGSMMPQDEETLVAGLGVDDVTQCLLSDDHITSAHTDTEEQLAFDDGGVFHHVQHNIGRLADLWTQYERSLTHDGHHARRRCLQTFLMQFSDTFSSCPHIHDILSDHL